MRHPEKPAVGCSEAPLLRYHTTTHNEGSRTLYDGVPFAGPPCIRRTLRKSKRSIQCERSPAAMRVYLVQHGESKSEEEDPQRSISRSEQSLATIKRQSRSTWRWKFR